MNRNDYAETLAKFLAGRSGSELLASSKGLCFGGAGATLALVLLIAQIGLSKPPVVWSLATTSVAFPLWLALALTYDIWAAFNLPFEEMWNAKYLRRAQTALFYISGFLTACSIGFLLYALQPLAALIFVAACSVGVLIVSATMIAATNRLMCHLAADCAARDATNH